MSSAFYVPRTLTSDERTYSETALLAASRFLVVLAEPGGGKTRLMDSLAHRLGAKCVSANVFRHLDCVDENIPLVIDAFDELARLDAQGIYRLLATAQKAKPTKLIISSRSSEWGNAETHAFKEFLGEGPLVVRLLEFGEEEQRAIFEDYAPGEDFRAFQAEVAKFDLDVILPNPQFLKLFADAYMQSGRSFSDKRSIFAQAIERLAREANDTIKGLESPLSSLQKVQVASEVFAKLLLSGSEGITTNEARAERIYPLLATLISGSTAPNAVLATRLFLPGESEDRHRPVHKIVSEYAAADYLTRRIMAPDDDLSLERCLSIIAPSSVVRDELRGLLGWMAALGNSSVQHKVIELDPYAVLANGDPSQLEKTSKRLLIKKLKEVEDKDPFFRRGDFGRRFSVAGFFSSEVVDEIGPLLSSPSEGHLRDLLLELLAGSPATGRITDELRALALSPIENGYTRQLAQMCLLELGGDYDLKSDLAVLIFEASHNSLNVVAKAIEFRGHSSFDKEFIASFLRICAHLYPGHKERIDGIGDRYFVKRLIAQLELPTIEYLLDELATGLACICGKKSYECDCRNGTSKIVGAMLDRYFELASGPYDPRKVWHWVGMLNFHQQQGADQSKAVEVLRNDTGLRQGIIEHVFLRLTDKEEIFEQKLHFFDHNSHSGLGFYREDFKFIVDLAFDTDNPTLWVAFLANHQYFKERSKRGPDALRRHMRDQAKLKPAFMREWTKANRDAAKSELRHRRPHARISREIKRRRAQQTETNTANISYVRENRELVESGRHWGCLVRFAYLVLYEPDKIEMEFGDEDLVRNALRNCIDFIAPQVPDLAKLAELQCASQYQQSENILIAASLEILKREGTLNELPTALLLALKTNLDMSYHAVEDDDHQALRTEVDRLAFSEPGAVERFCRAYIEPQVAHPDCKHPQVHWLRSDEIFSNVAPIVAFEWLCKYELMPFSALDTLFNIVAQHCSSEQLNELITYKCSEALLFWSPELPKVGLDERRKFWFVRYFYFVDCTDSPYWDWLKSDKENLLLFEDHSGPMSRGENSGWPQLKSEKIEAIFDAFFDLWPKVHLPSSYGTGSPKGETAYRFLTEVVWQIGSDKPDNAIPTLKRLLATPRYAALHSNMKNILARQERQKALGDYEPPTPHQLVEMLDKDEVVTVEDLRQLVLSELSKLQKEIEGGEFNTGELFYAGATRLGEEPCTRIIAERLNLILQPRNISVTPEHHLKHDKRCDFTAAKLIGGKRRLLVTEVKGQWHKDLYSAASNQLNNLYAIHPDAEQQGIYLVLWFGAHEKVKAQEKHEFSTADELKEKIEDILPSELKGLIDIFVLDVSRPVPK